MRKNKQLSLESIVNEMYDEIQTEINEPEFIGLLFDRIYNELNNVDEILIGDYSQIFNSVKRTPSIKDSRKIIKDNKKLITGGNTKECDFKIFLVKKEDNE